MEEKIKEKPESEVKVKMSICNKCKGIVRSEIVHMMNKRSTNEFALEAMEFNLSIKEIPLLKYRKLNHKFCNC